MDALAHLNASLTGRYRIEREIGRGGMATVYLARDVRHNRRVALKVLNPELGAVLGVERFLSEIQVTANLQHPNLLPLFDSGEADGLLFYVMPYVDGESLRATLQREKQLPVDEAVHVATAVASALDYAHRHGVIHRDLKPENILLHEGQPMVADFGIALAVSNAGGGRITQTGLSLGTPQYMSPEQATGDRAIDGRTDVYSLGAVLYEMLTGEPPHTGSTAQAIIAKVLTDRPRSIRLARDTVPPHVEGAVEKALAKLPADRFPTAHAFADAIVGKSVILPANVVTPSSLARARRSTPGRIVRSWYLWAPWTALLVLLVLLLFRSEPPRPPTTRFVIALPATASMNTLGGFLEMSPSGQGFAYAGQSTRGAQLFYRAMDDPQLKPIVGTENGAQPFFSFDGRWLGFIAQGRILKVELSGGAPQVIADLGDISPTGFAWGTEGRIVFGRIGGGLMQVPATGGTPTPFTQLDSGEVSHRGPAFLADGKTVSFQYWLSNAGEPRLAFASADGKVTRTTRTGTKFRQIGAGLLVHSNSQGTIFGARFDPKRFEIGEPVPLLSDVFVRPGGFSAWGASPNGSLIAVLGEPASRLVTVDREGAQRVLSAETRVFLNPRVSPDGSRIAVQVGLSSAASTDIWILERVSQTLTRLTFDGGSANPLWSKDGKRLVFSGRADRLNPENDLYWQPADGSAPADVLLRAPGRQWALGWSADGSLILDEVLAGSSTLISVLRPGDSATTPVVRAPPNSATRLPSVSPDGRWIAYVSNESGRTEVYVTALPRPGGKWQVSTNGGDQPLWSKSGREIFYRDPTHIVAARVATSPTFAILGRKALFEDLYLRLNTPNWDVMPDDRTFVMLNPTDDAAQLMVVTSWNAEIERRLAAARR
jgi:serine/threonine protein kinase